MQAKTRCQPAHCASSFFATTKSLITHCHAHTTTTTTAAAATTTTDARIIEQLISEKTFTQHELNVIAVVVDVDVFIVSDAAQNFDKHFSAEAYLKEHKISGSLKHRREY